MQPNNQNFFNQLYETRLILILETGPQSNVYRQVMLTPEQFKSLSVYIQNLMSSINTPPQDPSMRQGILMPIKDDVEIPIKAEIRTCYSKEIIGNAP